MKWYAFVLAGVLVWGLMLARSMGVLAPAAPPGPQPPRGTRASGYADTRLQDVHMIEQTSTRTTWEVFAREAALSHAQQRAHVSQLRTRLFQSTGAPLLLTADRGELHLATGDLTVWGHVSLRQQQAYTLETQRLRWLAAPRLLRTEALVRLRNPTVSIVGKGLVGDVDRQRFTLTEEVRASFRLP